MNSRNWISAMPYRLAVICWLCLLSPLMADDVLEQAIQSWKGDVLTIGRDDRGEPLRVLIDPGAWEYNREQTRYLYYIDVGDDEEALQGACKTISLLDALRNNGSPPHPARAVVLVTPDMLPGDPGRARLLTFPPKGDAYNSSGQVTASTIWRFAAWFGPDIIKEYHNEKSEDYQEFARAFVPGEEANVEWNPGSFAVEAQRSLAGLGAVLVSRKPMPLRRTKATLEYRNTVQAWSQEHKWVDDLNLEGPQSKARIEIQRRIDRTPEQVFDELLSVYGDQLNSVMYQPALAVLSRHRWAISRHDDEQLQQVQRILNPYLSGDKEALKGLGNGSQYAGHLAFAEWARHSGDAAAIKLVQAAADRGFDDQGQPLEAMPTHNEMSDAVFMACPILTAAAELTGEQKYLDMAGQHFRFMR
ncbi:MAG: glycoside hydrolase family 88 protein, partial [Planctomycetaceae bacterium]|nr:glycoside hydrolase family 88 protein [Planctomycetaceae bacterium]